MLEQFFQCPYCWAKISVLLDTSVASDAYIEDCEVCCNPIQVEYSLDDEELVYFDAQPIGQ
jgi:transcription elongation factor Elf1